MSRSPRARSNGGKSFCSFYSVALGSSWLTFPFASIVLNQALWLPLSRSHKSRRFESSRTCSGYLTTILQHKHATKGRVNDRHLFVLARRARDVLDPTRTRSNRVGERACQCSPEPAGQGKSRTRRQEKRGSIDCSKICKYIGVSERFMQVANGSGEVEYMSSLWNTYSESKSPQQYTNLNKSVTF